MPNIVLRKFMIFNSSDGQDEGREGDKLLFHWTKESLNNKVDLAEQIDDICLCDASINASIRLNSTIYATETNTQSQVDTELNCEDFTSNCSTVITNNSGLSINNSDNDKLKKRSLVMTFDSSLVIIVEVEPELSIWMAVHVGLLATQIEQQQQHQQQQSSNTSAQQLKQAANSQQPNQLFDPQCLSSASIERIISNIYSRFCLLNGTFLMIVNNIEQQDNISDNNNKQSSINVIIREKIRSTCEQYFSNVLNEIHLNSFITNIPALYNFIVYLDLNPITLMKVNSFINHLVCLDAKQIRHTIVIFNDRLLWSSMNMHDTRLVYNYLVAEPIRDALQEELIREMDKVRRIRDNMPIYLTDISNEQNNLENSISTLSITNDSCKNKLNRLSKFYLTVFRSSNNMTLGLVLRDTSQSKLLQKCEQMLTSDTRLGVVPLASLAQSVGQNFLKSNSISGSGYASRASSLSNKKNLSSSGKASSSTIKNHSQIDQKYLYFDKLSVSAYWSQNMDSNSQGIDQNLLNTSSDSATSPELTKKNRKLRLTKYLLELEPELQQLKQQTRLNRDVKEFLAKTTSDNWLTVMNSKYRSIYSIYKMRNVGLSEAQQYANNLNTSMTSMRHRP